MYKMRSPYLHTRTHTHILEKAIWLHSAAKLQRQNVMNSNVISWPEGKNYHVFKADRMHNSGGSSVFYLKYKFSIN